MVLFHLFSKGNGDCYPASYRQKMVRGCHLMNSVPGELNGMDRKCPNPTQVLRVAPWPYYSFIWPPVGSRVTASLPLPLNYASTSNLTVTHHRSPLLCFQCLFSLLMYLSQLSFPIVPAHHGRLTNPFISQSINGRVKWVKLTFQCAPYTRGTQSALALTAHGVRNLRKETQKAISYCVPVLYKRKFRFREVNSHSARQGNH